MGKVKPKNTSQLYIFTLLMLMAVSSTVFYISSAPFRLKKYRYEGFGVPVPANYSIVGIDVSHYQSKIDWQDVAQMQYQHLKIGFCFMKATEGAGNVDYNYLHNWDEAKKAGLPVGAYHYFYCGTSGKIQADNFIAIVNLDKGDLPPVLDIERCDDITADQLQHEIQDWLDVVEQTYKVKPVIYTNLDFYNDYLAGKFDNYPLWIANFFNTDKPSVNRSWSIWQRSEAAHVNGIGGFVDFNVFNGDSAAFRSMLIK